MQVTTYLAGLRLRFGYLTGLKRDLVRVKHILELIWTNWETEDMVIGKIIFLLYIIQQIDYSIRDYTYSWKHQKKISRHNKKLYFLFLLKETNQAIFCFSSKFLSILFVSIKRSQWIYDFFFLLDSSLYQLLPFKETNGALISSLYWVPYLTTLDFKFHWRNTLRGWLYCTG